MKVVLFNAPPEAGKDVAAKVCCGMFGLDHREFKAKIYDLVKVIYDITDEQLEYLKLRENKETPSDLLGGKSLREALINTSEHIIKPNFGDNYFGTSIARTLQNNTAVSDSGFVDELLEVVNKVGEDNVLLVRIHRDGYDFVTRNVEDSRRYIPDGTIKHMVDIRNEMPATNNDKEFFEFKQRVYAVVGEWLGIL